MEKLKAVLMVGISGSGKSTKARAEYPTYEIIERDAVRRQILDERGELDLTKNMWSLWKFNDKNETEVTKRVNAKLKACSDARKPVVIADTNVSQTARSVMLVKLRALGYEVEVVTVECDLITAFKRDEKRRDTVGRDVIYGQYLKYLEFIGRKKYVPDVTKPKCILVDIDGTAAHANGARGMFEWMKVKSDTPDESVRLIVNSLPQDIKVIFMSGRDEVCRQLTQEWLDECGFRNDGLYMREEGCMEKDTIVKERLFWKFIEPNYNVLFCIDDRPVVCRLYHELGVKVFAVGNQHIEF